AGRTPGVLASSPLLLDRADRGVLVDGGQAVAVGTHRELLAREPRYRAVVTRETDEELAAKAPPADPLGGGVGVAPVDALDASDALEALEGESA
ncbi:ABC transporter ATP-binding protein, partial [Streptomyces sp. NPDC059556]